MYAFESNIRAHKDFRNQVRTLRPTNLAPTDSNTCALPAILVVGEKITLFPARAAQCLSETPSLQTKSGSSPHTPTAAPPPASRPSPSRPTPGHPRSDTPRHRAPCPRGQSQPLESAPPPR